MQPFWGLQSADVGAYQPCLTLWDPVASYRTQGISYVHQFCPHRLGLWMAVPGSVTVATHLPSHSAPVWTGRSLLLIYSMDHNIPILS